MITAERLEELRNQCATVYIVFAGEKEATALNIVDVDEWLLASRFLEKVFETKEQAEWAEKMYTERPERFEPPMWCDAGNYMFRFVINNCFYEFYSGNIIFLKDMCGVVHFKFEQTKENYIKACEIVRDLFNKGGVK